MPGPGGGERRPTAAARLGQALLSIVVVVLAAVALAAVLAFFALRSVDPPDLSELALGEECVASVGDFRAELDPEQAGNAALVAGIAERRGLPARAATIALATAIQESDLRNIDFGDRDSLGLFQQRPSQGWGTPEQVMDPVYATNAFYDALVEIDGYETMTVTDVAQQVQRSAFPLAYGDHEGEGRALASALAGYSPGTLSCELSAPPDDAGEPAATGGGELAANAGALAADVTTWGPLDSVTTRPAETADPALAGRVLVLDATAAGEPGRQAWALGHTAVALAGTHDVLAVVVDGRVWLREPREAGWQGLAEAGPAGGGDELLPSLPEAAPGTVLVVVA